MKHYKIISHCYPFHLLYKYFIFLLASEWLHRKLHIPVTVVRLDRYFFTSLLLFLCFLYNHLKGVGIKSDRSHAPFWLPRALYAHDTRNTHSVYLKINKCFKKKNRKKGKGGKGVKSKPDTVTYNYNSST